MTDIPIRNPSVDIPAERRAEEVTVDDERKCSKQEKRPRKEFDEHVSCNADENNKQKENNDVGSGTKEGSDVKEVSTAKEEYDSSDSEEDLYFAIHTKDCKECVDDEVCKCGGCSSPSTGSDSSDASDSA